MSFTNRFKGLFRMFPGCCNDISWFPGSFLICSSPFWRWSFLWRRKHLGWILMTNPLIIMARQVNNYWLSMLNKNINYRLSFQVKLRDQLIKMGLKRKTIKRLYNLKIWMELVHYRAIKLWRTHQSIWTMRNLGKSLWILLMWMNRHR